MISLTRKYRFSASHRLHAAHLSDEENRAIYDKCNNPYGHGHNYELELSVRGPIDGATGRVVSIARLDALVRDEVVGVLDRANLNEDLPEMKGIVPTTENLVDAVQRRLLARWPQVFPAGAPRLDRLKIQETRRNSFELRTR